MPHRYESMRDKFYREFRRKGMSHKKALEKAKEKASRIYNATKKPGEPNLHH